METADTVEQNWFRTLSSTSATVDGGKVSRSRLATAVTPHNSVVVRLGLQKIKEFSVI